MLPTLLVAFLLSFLDTFANAAPAPAPERFALVDTRRSYALTQREGQISRALHNESASAVAAGIIPLSLSSDGSSYWAPISAGGINFRLALDTASSDLFFVSSDCKTSSCRSVPRYPLTYESPTFQSVNNNQTAFSVSFADTTAASGFIARESVKVANLTSPTQAFGVVTDSNITFVDQVTGVLGLGFPRLSKINGLAANATPFFSSLAEQGLVDYPMFGVYLTRNDSGTLALGAVDAGVVTNISNFEWHYVVPFAPFGTANNVSSYLFWALELSMISVNGTGFKPTPTYPESTSNKSIAIIDVGNSGIYGPYNDVAEIYSNMDGSRLVDESGQWAVPCENDQTMTFSFGGRNYTMQPTDYIIGPVKGNPSLCLTWPRASPPSSDGIDWQLGTPFLRTVYTVFSYGINEKEAPIVGFYPLSNVTTLNETVQDVSSYLSAASSTVATTLPNSLLAPPSYTTPAYSFNTSVTATPGALVASELATSTYSPIFDKQPVATGLPEVLLLPNGTVFVITTSGKVVTETSIFPSSTLPLGVPYEGWSSAASRFACPSIPALLALLIGFVFPFFRYLT